MKVILAVKSVFPYHFFGGVQKYVYNFAKSLLRNGIEVEIIAPLDDKKERTEIFNGIKYTLLWPAIYSYLEYPIGWWGTHVFSYRLSQYLRGKQFDILHSFDVTGYQYLKVQNRKLVIAHVFSDNYLTNPISLWQFHHLFGFKTASIKKEKIKLTPSSHWTTKVKYFLQFLFKIKPMSYCFKKADSIFFEEETFCDEVTRLFKLNRERCYVLPVGIDAQSISQRIKTPQLTREVLGFRNDDLILITVNRLAADKGVDKVVLSLDEIHRHIPEAKLIIVGDGYQKKEILNLISTRKLEQHIRHFAKVSEEELYDLYRISDIYICAFSYAGSSISTLEAMACGLPVITTGQPWLVKDKLNGIYIENNNPILIGNAVRELMKMPQRQRQKEISKDKASRYDWDYIAKEAIGHYQELLNQ